MPSPIDTVELKIRGSDWNETTLSEYVRGRTVKREYHGVPKEAIMKLLNASKAPDVSDFEGWLRDYDEKQKKKNASAVPSPSEDSWWG
jgi:hypothetical protein